MQQQPFSSEPVTITHTLNLGHHTLLLMSDGSIDLLAANKEQQTSALAEHGVRLDSMETYRLFISLREQFR